MTDLTQTTLAILAGGEGSRMGFPKSQLQFGGVPILEYLTKRLAWPGPTLLVTAPGREHPDGWELFDEEAIDAVANQGPLRGVLTALEHARSNTCAVITVDMPGIGIEQLSWAIQQLQTNSHRMGLMLQRTVGGKPQIEPFPFICRISAIGVITARLADERRSMHSLAGLPGFAAEEAPATWLDSVWTNLNRPEDLRANCF